MYEVQGRRGPGEAVTFHINFIYRVYCCTLVRVFTYSRYIKSVKPEIGKMRINMTATTVKRVGTGKPLKVIDRGDCARQRRHRGHTGQQFPQSL